MRRRRQRRPHAALPASAAGMLHELCWLLGDLWSDSGLIGVLSVLRWWLLQWPAMLLMRLITLPTFDRLDFM